MGMIRRGIVMLIFLFLSYSLVKNYVEFQKNLQLYNSSQGRLLAQQQENAKLLTQKTLKSSPHEVEKTIRNQLNFLRDGEIAVIVPPPSPTPTPIIASAPPVYRQWWNTFFSLSR